jgi:glutathione synthase/RimK-type ligase-like ATP-grasp enzyme
MIASEGGSEPARSVGPWAAQWRVRANNLREVEARLALQPGDVALLLLRARLLEDLGLREDAKNAYLDVLVRDRFHYDAMMRLGALLATSGLPAIAKTVFAEAALRHPQQAAAHTALANVLLDLGDGEGARRAFGTALEVDSIHHEAHRGLAIVLERAGDPFAAEPHWRMGFPDGSIAVAPYRGAADPVRLLVVCSAIGGNIPLQNILDDRVFETATLVAESYAPSMTLPRHDVVFNAIGDADRCSRALAIAQGVLAGARAPVVNLPARVRVSGRVAIAERFRDLEGVVVPRIVAVPRATLESGAGSAALAGHGFGWPVLLRSPGFHTGEHFALVAGPERLAEIVASLPGEELLAISYLDTRRADGTVRKYRVMFIDGRPYPLHLAISTDWKVHYFTAGMAENAAYREEERGFLEAMPAVLGPAALATLERIRAALGLDYGGVDFALDAEGRIVVFETNATMVILAPDSGEHWTYRRKPIQRAIEATRAMLTRRAREHRHESSP